MLFLEVLLLLERFVSLLLFFLTNCLGRVLSWDSEVVGGSLLKASRCGLRCFFTAAGLSLFFLAGVPLVLFWFLVLLLLDLFLLLLNFLWCG